MPIQSRQELVNYTLRKLGAPVINIEVDPLQLEDALDDALHHYTEYHFDGITRQFMSHKISGTTVVVDDASSISKGETLTSADNKTRALVDSVSGNTIIINNQRGLIKFAVNDTVTADGKTTPMIISSITLGDIDNQYVTVDEHVVSVTRILNVSSIMGGGDYMFDLNYQIMMSELQALTKSGVSQFYQTLNYLGHLDFILKKEKNFEFHRRTNRLYLEISWSNDVKVDDIVVAEVYKEIDPTTFPEVYDDIWIKRYFTALVKKQWGQNLSKYDGMQLPGGITYSGKQLVIDAGFEIEKLEDEAINSSAPLGFQIG